MKNTFKEVISLRPKKTLGDFTEGNEPDGSNLMWKVLEMRAQTLRKPVYAGLPAGHGSIQRVLPLGVSVTLTADSSQLVGEPLVKARVDSGSIPSTNHLEKSPTERERAKKRTEKNRTEKNRTDKKSTEKKSIDKNHTKKSHLKKSRSVKARSKKRR